MKLLALLLLAACAYGTTPANARIGDRGAKTVAYYWPGPTPLAWRRSPWFRLTEDVITPLRVVVSTDGFACPLGPGVEEPRHGDAFVCPTPWRFPQHR